MQEHERQIVIALWDRRSKRALALTADALRDKLVDLFREDAVSPDDALARAAQSGLVRDSEEGWTLTDEGSARAPELGLAHFKRTFEETYELALASDAFNTYCEKVYGAALAQLNLLTIAELAELAELLPVGPGDRVIDLGCGAGMISEYLAGKTGSHITGVDYSEAAIRQARARAADGVSFEVADLSELQLEAGSWAAAVAIDTLYFVDDLTSTIARIMSGLAAGGAFVTYYTVFLQQGQSLADLEADATPLAQTLAHLDLSWTAVEKTEMQRQIFERSLAAIEELRPAFVAEDNDWLIRARVDEANDTLARHDAGETRRYRYVVKAPR